MQSVDVSMGASWLGVIGSYLGIGSGSSAPKEPGRVAEVLPKAEAQQQSKVENSKEEKAGTGGKKDVENGGAGGEVSGSGNEQNVGEKNGEKAKAEGGSEQVSNQQGVKRGDGGQNDGGQNDAQGVVQSGAQSANSQNKSGCKAQAYDVQRGSIVCKNGEGLKIKRGGIHVKKFGDNAVHVKGGINDNEKKSVLNEDSSEKEDNSGIKIIEMDRVYITTAGPSSDFSVDERGSERSKEDNEEVGLGSAVFAEGNAGIVLDGSTIKGFLAGLEASEGGQILMKNGSIKKSYIGATAYEGAIVLQNVNIDVERLSDRIDDLLAVGLQSAEGGIVAMQSGSIAFPVGGVVVRSMADGLVSLKDVKITEKKDKESPGGAQSVLFQIEGGIVSADQVDFEGSGISVVWILNEPTVDNGGFVDARNSSLGGVIGSFDEKVKAALSNGSMKVSADITSSKIKVMGKKAYGVQFSYMPEEEVSALKDAESLTSEDERVSALGNVVRTPAVLLEKTSLQIPEGVAVYGDGLSGSVILKNESNLSGNLLLQAEEGFNLSLFVDKSTIKGGAFVDETSKASLFFSRGSEWYVTKSQKEGSERKNCIDSCVSSIRLADSTIRFVFPENANGAYQTLRVGKGNDTVYTAVGQSEIHFNARLGISNSSDGQSNAQISDRLLIHGNVSGKTTIYVNGVSENTDKKTDKEDEKSNNSYSVSIIQVFGNAEKDSFILNGGYVTLDGLPYQYVLRAYGPMIPPKMRYFDNKLVGKNTNVWDFRLENKNFVPLIEAYDAADDKTDLSQGTSSNSQSILVASSEGTTDTDIATTTDPNGGEVDTANIAETAGPNVGKIGAVDTVSVISHVSGSSEDSAPVIPPRSDSLTRSETFEDSYDYDEDDAYDEDDDYGDEDDEDAISVPSSTEPSTELSGSASADSEIPEGFEIVEDLFYTEPVKNSVSKEPAPISSAADHRRSEELEESETSSSENSMPAESTQSSSVVGSEESEEATYVLSSSSALGRSDDAVEVISLSPGSSTAAPRGDSASVVSATLGRSETITPTSLPVSVSRGNVPVQRILSAASGETGASTAVPVVPIKNADKKTVSSQCNDTKQNGAGELQIAYLCNDGQSHTMHNLILKPSDENQHSMHAKKQNTVINLESATISGADSYDSKNNVDVTKLQAVSAVLADDGAEVVLNKKSTVQSSLIGLEAQRGGKVQMNDGSVNAHYVGALAGSGSSVNLSNTTINVAGNLATAGLASNGGEITMESGTITLTDGVAVRSEVGGSVKLSKVSITAKKTQEQSGATERFGRAAFLLSDNGSVDFAEGNVVTDASAFWVRGNGDAVKTDSSRRKRSSDARSSINRANIESSTVRVEGGTAYGIYFDGTAQRSANKQKQVVNRNPVRQTRSVKESAVLSSEKAPTGVTGVVSLKKTDFEVLKNIAIYGNNSGGRVSLENKATLSGDLLLMAENNSNISLSVDNSIIVGGARVEKGSYAQLDLTNGSEWILKRSVHKSWGTPGSECIDSCVSSVNLVNSRIEFSPSETEESRYQTLRIGEGAGTVYSASGDASIYLNARLNPNDPENKQVTDRLLILGDVSGKTVLHVQGVSGSAGENNGSDKIAHSVSVIQVYGKAERDSFQLNGHYVALGNSPYKYTLRSYSPEMTSSEEHVRQKFMKDGGAFWNFRLENQYVKSGGFDASVVPTVGSVSHSEGVVRSVVPQVPTYLTLPNSVFYAGLMDISNQNKQLELLRTTSNGMMEIRENPALYLRGYGGSYRYASDLSAFEYGYGSDMSYKGVEAGVLLQTIENADNAISFGVMGSHGKLSLQPVDVEQSQKSAFDKWTATAYGSMQHQAGFYVDGLLSYGLFKGDVVTLARGKTATLKGKPLSVSLIGGQTFATGCEGFVFDPQVQVVYQHLQFNKARDIDNFDIEMGKLDQWVARVGGRLTKVPTGSEGVNAIAFYGKLHLVHGFGGKQTVHFKDAFQLGAFGSSLETGLGFNAKVSSQFSLHGDLVYQHKLTKAGFSGTSFSGGLRYQF
ncbi:hypothetical protein GCM10023261_14590 [Bartonella jaculi]|uniref:Autotransporter domain-containing protein n=1 Tax=Bartonella jaculi TaxID=686226 RepID=A0ABP9N6F5_9HYPH